MRHFKCLQSCKYNIIRSMSTIRAEWKPRYFEIGTNFTDKMFEGVYHGSSKHSPDLDKVIDRAFSFNVNHMLVTSSEIKESRDNIELCKRYEGKLYSTAGVHPCQVAAQFYKKVDGEPSEVMRDDVDNLLEELRDMIIRGHDEGIVKAFGEIGMDYDRLHFSSKDQQKTMFKRQLDLIADLKHLSLPLFLHMRSCCDDFISIIAPYIENGDIPRGSGVIHSFTGSEDDLQKLSKLGFYFSVNGCSLRTPENIEVASKIPKSHLMIETDAPWCEVRRTHAGYKSLKPYPNQFYPELVARQDDSLAVEAVDPIKRIAKSGPTMHEFLPFPCIKKENFDKHVAEIVESKVINSKTVVGPFSFPMVKSRNEPVAIGLIAQLMCDIYGIKDESEIQDFIDLVYENTCNFFKI